MGLAPALDVTYGVRAVRVGRIHRPEWVLELPGGKAVNVARALSTLGAEVRVVVPLGGPNGTAVEEALDREGIVAAVLPNGAGTRRCVTALDADTGAATEFYEPAPPLDAAVLGRLAEVIAAVEGWLVVSGSMPGGTEDEVAGMAAAAERRGVRVAADVQGVALQALLAQGRPDVVKVNRAEAEDLFGPGDPARLAADLRGAGARVAVVTDGAEGAVAAAAEGTWRARPGERGRYAVGSGDCFQAGLVLALSRGDDLPRALALATSAATANTRVPGAARFRPTDIAEVAASVRVEPLRAPSPSL
ncbi:MAG: PfkB family carbohydrate kinase [Propionicimonas sp.]|uniref:1-phosphofructokinase family hexose kinase n=1 Tax=Propionicimonas sp. TaxID=1955623 RepID=UPI003D0A23E0